jgi:hypothetical protein
MAVITPATNRGFSGNMLMLAHKLPGFTAGESIPKMTPVRIDPTDGKIYITSSGCTVISGTTNGSYVAYAGFVPFAVASGEEGLTVLRGLGGEYATGMTPGALLFLSTSGSLNSGSAIVSGDKPVAQALTATKIFIF